MHRSNKRLKGDQSLSFKNPLRHSLPASVPERAKPRPAHVVAQTKLVMFELVNE